MILFIDAEYFLKHQESLTKQKYIKKQCGPGFEPTNWENYINQLIEDSNIIVEQKEKKKFYKAVSQFEQKIADIEFEAETQKLVDYFLHTFREKSSKEISDLTHNDVWEETEFDSEIKIENFVREGIKRQKENA